MITRPWIRSPWFDGVFILGPSIVATLLVLVFRDRYGQTTEMSLGAWIALILCIDVAHVYSTLYRTYFNSAERQRRRTLYTMIPLSCWLAGVLLYSVGARFFWSVLAYLAVFHFIRQQYGFLALYARNEAEGGGRLIDTSMIYLATLYPIVYWHTHLPRNFQWFIEGDFIAGLPVVCERIVRALYLAVILVYLIKEIALFLRTRTVNLPRNLLVFGTAAAWFTGIVLLNGDMAFTLTNVVTHGIPYMALIWHYGRKGPEGAHPHRLFLPALIPLFLLILVSLAYFEEGFWDALIWQEKGALFPFWSGLGPVTDVSTLSWIVPLLAVPQATHYVLDGFIWRFKKDAVVREVLFDR